MTKSSRPKREKIKFFVQLDVRIYKEKKTGKKEIKKNIELAKIKEKKNKYAKDDNYSSKIKIRSNKIYHSLSDDEKFKRNKRNREKEDPIKRRKYFRNYQNQRNKEDINHRLAGSLRARIRGAIKKDKTTKSFRTMKLVGCTIKELKKHLEKQFRKGMNWNNYGLWHIDHIEPINNFNLQDKDQQLECFNYSNLQPLWGRENLRKGTKSFAHPLRVRSVSAINN